MAIRRSTGDIAYVTDHLNLFTRWEDRKVEVHGSANQVLWHLFWRAIREHEGQVGVRWTKNHTTAEHILSGQTTVQDHTGNEVAMRQLEGDQVSDIRKLDGLALQVMRRLVAVNIGAIRFSKGLGPDQGPERRPCGTRVGTRPLGELVRRSSHSLKRSNGRWLCTGCGAGRSWARLACWLRKQPVCQGRPRPAPNRPAGVPVLLPQDRQCHVGCTYFHTSHNLALFRGAFLLYEMWGVVH